MAAVFLSKTLFLFTGLDYQTLSNFPVRFGTELTMTVRIPINNDDISEVTERFRVRLSSTSSDVIVPSGQDVADVTIFDTDGELNIGRMRSKIY